MQILDKLAYCTPSAPRISQGRMAVIDIGSSSIRLVIYDDVQGYPFMILNQKIWAAFAENKGEGDGPFRLKQDKIDRALAALEWFVWTARQTQCSHMAVIATSAVREAENGDHFVSLAERKIGGRVHVLSGEAEAHLATTGAMSSIPDAQGVVMDLGGGSLELSDTNQQQFTSLPLGVLSLKNLANNDPVKAKEILSSEFKKIDWLKNLPGKNVVAIGSGMRSIARLHMAAFDYPLEITHDYELPLATGKDFCDKLIRQEDLGLKVRNIAKAYQDVLPYRAAALSALLEVEGIDNVRFATFGIREGVLFSQMASCPVSKDPLKAFALELAHRQGRGMAYGRKLAKWCAELLPNTDKRFLEVAALFAETGWREQALYRAISQYNHVLGGAYVGATHAMRIKLATTAFFCHEDELPESLKPQVEYFLSPQEIAECKAIGSLFELAQFLDPGAIGTLDQFKVVRDNSGAFTLSGPDVFLAMGSEEVAKKISLVGANLSALA